MNKGFLFNAFIGGIVSLAVALAIYDAGNVLVFVFVTIVCTYGLSLIVYLPLMYLVGLLCQPVIAIIVTGLVRIKILPDKMLLHFNSLSASDKALTTYITDCKARSMPDWDIKDQLLRAGWSEEQIKAAWKRI